jgi:uncharacterized protein YbjT (DUF2867 family)
VKLVVIGGTGRLGSKLVPFLVERGHEAVAASPSRGIDTITGEGLATALADAAVVVDVSNPPAVEPDAARAFFDTSMRNLQAAEAAAGVGHHVVLSVVGTDRLTESEYFQAKLAQEALVEGSSVAYTILRATQFFEFVESIADAATDGDVVRVPAALFQPMALDDAVAAVGRAALAKPANRMIETGGPERFPIREPIARLLASRGDPRTVVADPQARYFGARLDERTLVPDDGAPVGAIRFGDWLKGLGA